PGKIHLTDKGQAHSALAGVMGDGVGHQGNLTLLGYLLHDLGLSDTGRPHEQDGPLAQGRNPVLTVFVLFQISPDGIFDFFLGSFDIHNWMSSSKYSGSLSGS